MCEKLENYIETATGSGMFSYKVGSYKWYILIEFENWKVKLIFFLIEIFLLTLRIFNSIF